MLSSLLLKIVTFFWANNWKRIIGPVLYTAGEAIPVGSKFDFLKPIITNIGMGYTAVGVVDGTKKNLDAAKAGLIPQ